ncbi:MAG: hypothetical protein U1E65_28155 [Myxococcota bacterium]
MKARWTSLGTLLGVACGTGTHVLPPPADLGPTVVIWRESESGTLLGATAFRSAETWSYQEELEPDGVLYLASYAQPIDALGLVSGQALSPKTADCRLRAPSFVVRLERSGAPRWIPTDVTVTSVLTGDQRCDPCFHSFSERRQDLSSAGLNAAVAWGPDRLFGIGTAGGRWMIDPSASRPIEGCGTAEAYAVLPLDGDRFWLGELGRIERIRVDTRTSSCTLEERLDLPGGSAPRKDQARWLAGPSDGSELYVLSSTGALILVNERGAQLVSNLPLNPRFLGNPKRTRNGGLVWLGPGRVAANASAPEVWWFQGGQRARAEIIPLQTAEQSVTELALLGDGRVAVGGGDGAVHLFEDGKERLSLRSSGVGDDIGTIVPHADGFLATARPGTVIQWSASVGYCSLHYPIAAPTNRGDSALEDAKGELVLPDTSWASTENMRAFGQIIYLTGEY